MTTEIILTLLLTLISWYAICELIQVNLWLEKKKYIYDDVEHSTEHFVYLFSYLVSVFLLIAYVLTYDRIIFIYFIVMFLFSTFFLLKHIRKERLSSK